MKIGFFSSQTDVKIGSYRIWILDLGKYFRELGLETLQSGNVNDFVHCPIIFVNKNDYSQIPHLKRKYPTSKVGAINLHAKMQDLNPDFIIVGSVEEKTSLSWHPHVYLFPLIENQFRHVPLKRHYHSRPLRICYHGNDKHLIKMECGARQAIESINQKYKVELHVISANNDSLWEVGRPRSVKIERKKYNYDTIIEDIQYCDIGIVPNVANIRDFDANFKPYVNEAFGMHETDFHIQYKNKSNAGRAFVFHQLGIPVIADLTPSNFHVMGDLDTGFLVANAPGWLQALEALSSPEIRQQVAEKAFQRFNELYDPIDWASRLLEQIQRLDKIYS